MSGSKCARLSGALVKQLLDSVDSVLFDCDGVIWRGDQAIPGAAQVINLLKEKGKRVFFVTNNSSKTRKMYAEKMSMLGFDVNEEEVFGTAYCSAVYLKTVCKLEGKVYLIGSNAMKQELEAVGIQQTGVGPDHVSGKQTDWANVPLDPEVKAVLVGFDEQFSYMKLNRAFQYLTQQDCLFVGTNRDSRLPLEGGKAVPGKASADSIYFNKIIHITESLFEYRNKSQVQNFSNSCLHSWKVFKTRTQISRYAKYFPQKSFIIDEFDSLCSSDPPDTQT